MAGIPRGLTGALVSLAKVHGQACGFDSRGPTRSRPAPPRWNREGASRYPHYMGRPGAITKGEPVTNPDDCAFEVLKVREYFAAAALQGLLAYTFEVPELLLDRSW